MERFKIKLDNINLLVLVDCGELTFKKAFNCYNCNVEIVSVTIETDNLENNLKGLISENLVFEAIQKEVYGN
jgi:transcription elongation factor Elf1